MTPEIDITSHLITVAPVVGVLIYFIYYFRAELKRKDKRNDALNDELRSTEKESLIVMKDLNQTLKELIIKIENI